MKKIFILEGLDCAHCANKIEEKISHVESVKSVTVNFITSKMILDLNENYNENTLEKIKNIIINLEPQINIKKG